MPVAPRRDRRPRSGSRRRQAGGRHASSRSVVSPIARRIAAAAESALPAQGATAPSPAAARAELTRFPIRLLGLGELSSKTVDLTAEVAGFRSSGLVHAQLETLACALRLFECVPPIPVKVHQLSAMHEATAGERDDVGLLLAPACQDGRPLLAHDAARRPPRTPGSRRSRPFPSRSARALRRRRHHRLVEQREPLSNMTALDEDAALHMHREGKEIRVAETLRRIPLPRLQSRPRPSKSPASLVLEGDRHQHVALLRAFTVPARSTNRCARPSHPVAGPISPRSASCMPIQNAHRAAFSDDPVVGVTLKCARPRIRTQSSSRPSM